MIRSLRTYAVLLLSLVLLLPAVVSAQPLYGAAMVRSLIDVPAADARTDVSVLMTDELGQPAPGVKVHFTSPDGAHVTPVAVSDKAGRATVHVKVKQPEAGQTYLVKATPEGQEPVYATIRVLETVPTQISYQMFGEDGALIMRFEAGAPFQMVVMLRDEAGAFVAGREEYLQLQVNGQYVPVQWQWDGDRRYVGTVTAPDHRGTYSFTLTDSASVYQPSASGTMRVIEAY